MWVLNITMCRTDLKTCFSVTWFNHTGGLTNRSILHFLEEKIQEVIPCKGPWSVILRGRPLMIWGEGRRKLRKKFQGPFSMKKWKRLNVDAPPATRVVKFLRPKVPLHMQHTWLCKEVVKGDTWPSHLDMYRRVQVPSFLLCWGNFGPILGEDLQGHGYKA